MKYSVAVRTLCEFTAKVGDLDLRFTPSATALEGMAGHAMVAARRGERYETEVWLTGRYRDLVVRGRADGFDPDAGRLEEVKTYRGDLHAMPHVGRWPACRWLLHAGLGYCFPAWAASTLLGHRHRCRTAAGPSVIVTAAGPSR